MNPLEAMAKAIFAAHLPNYRWGETTAETKAYFIKLARAARDALADNVSEKMRNALEDRRHDLAAAIRAAGEDK
jgi:hypothetical protein